MNLEPLALYHMADTKLPEGYADWEPESLKAALRINNLECEKLLACIEVFHNHTPFVDWHIFEKVCIVFNDREADFVNGQELSPSEVMWGLKVIRNIDDHSKFDTEVLSYIATILHMDGLGSKYLPEDFKVETSLDGFKITNILDELNNEDSTDDNHHQEYIVKNMVEYCKRRTMNNDYR